MYVIEVESQRGRCLHRKKQEIKKKKRGNIQEIVAIHQMRKQFPFPPQQIPEVEAEDDNATLKEASYREDDIIDPLVNRQSCEEFNNYVNPDANVTQQQPWSVVQYPNRSCQPVVDVNLSPTFESAKKLAST